VKVIDFTPKPTKAEREVRLPTTKELEDLMNGIPMKSCVVVLVNEDESLSYMFDGASPMEAIGLMETAKFSILTQPLEELTDDE
jgi:hypothetical protein